MYLLLIFMVATLANAAPKLANRHKEENEYSPPQPLQNDHSFLRLKTLIRRESDKAALYSEEEMKEYLGTVHFSDSWWEAQQSDGPVNVGNNDADADNEHPSSSATPDEVIAPNSQHQSSISSAVRPAVGQDSAVWDSRNPILSDEGQDLEDDGDEEMSKPRDVPKNNKITISIDAVRIPTKNLRDSLSSHVNDEHDNRIANSRRWGNQGHSAHFRGYTRQSSPSAEAVAILTQKLANMEVEMGRLKEAVLLQGAVHIKTSERIEMMLLAQGKLAVKNDVDTRKLLKRVRRCCSCSGRGKAQRSLHRARKGRTRDRPGKENNATKISDAMKMTNNSSSAKNDNAEASDSQSTGRQSEDQQVIERSQSDSYSERSENPPPSRVGDRGSDSSRRGKGESEPHQSVSASFQNDHSRGNKTSVPNNRHVSSPQVADVSDTANGSQQHGKSQNHTAQNIRPEQQHSVQKDQLRQMTTLPEVLFITTPSTPMESLTTTPKTTTFHEINTTLSPTSPHTTDKLTTLTSTTKESIEATNSIHHDNEDNSQIYTDNILMNTTTQESQTARAPTFFNVHRTERSTMPSGQDRNEDPYTETPVIKDQTDPSNIDAANPDDNTLLKESNRRQKQTVEELPATKRGDMLDLITSTAPHASTTDKSTADRKSTLIDGLSEIKPTELRSINNGALKDSSPDSMSYSDSHNTTSITPAQAHNYTNMNFSGIYHDVNASSSGKTIEERNKTYKSTANRNNNVDIRQDMASDEKNLSKDNSYSDHKNEHELSADTDPVHHGNSILSDGRSNHQTEPDDRENSVDKISPVNIQHPSTTTEHNSEVAGSTSTPKNQFSETTSSDSKSTIYNDDQSNRDIDMLTTRIPNAATPQVSATLSTVSSGGESEHRTNPTNDSGIRTSSTTTSQLVEHRDVEILHQSTTSSVTTTVSTKSSANSTTELPVTTTTSTPTSPELTSSSTPYVTSTSERKETTVTSTVSPEALAGVHGTSVSTKKTWTSTTEAATTALPSTSTASTETTTETAPTTTELTTTEREDGELSVDLSTGEITNNLPGVEWVVLPSSSRRSTRRLKRSLRRSNSRPCVIQGVLKFTFTPPPPPRSSSHRRRGHRHSSHGRQHHRHRHGHGAEDDAGGGAGAGGGNDGEGGAGGRRRLLLDMEFDRPYRWVFNLGDSIANNGFSGDGSVQENDCEAQGYGKAFAVYASDKHPNGRQKLLTLANDFIHDRLTLMISDRTIGWDNHRGKTDQLTHDSLFALSGQSDGQGSVNYDVFLGLNRVIAGHYRRGHGLCRVKARWLADEV